jgi:hypothetical protein
MAPISGPVWAFCVDCGGYRIVAAAVVVPCGRGGRRGGHAVTQRRFTLVARRLSRLFVIRFQGVR